MADNISFFSRMITLSDLEDSEFMRYANEDILAGDIDLDASFERVMSTLKNAPANSNIVKPTK